MPAAHDHHLRMLDMVSFLNQGQSSDTSLILEQYDNEFGAADAGAMLFPSQYSAIRGTSHIGASPGRLDQSHLPIPAFINGMMKLETMEGAAVREQSAVTNVTSVSGDASGYSSSGEREMTNNGADGGSKALTNGGMGLNINGLTVKVKTKRKVPGMPDPDSEVVVLSPKTLLATNRFVCEICNKGFQRDQNLQLHRRGHNLPWKLKQRGNKEVRRKVYVCPEVSCVHHDPARALGDLTGIKKHFSRKHGEKKWKCDKCSKRYAVQSDWKAHSKTCGTREYRCDCGTLFSRRDSFITHRAFCDALAEESALRLQNQIAEGDHHLPSALSNAMVAQLAAQAGAGSASPFGAMIGAAGAAGLLPSSKNQHSGLLDISPFDTSGARSGRLPVWLTGGVGAGGNLPDHHHHQFLGNHNSPIMNPNGGLLNSYQRSVGTGSTSLFGASALQSPSSVVVGLSQMAAAGNGMLYTDIDNLDRSSTGSFAGFSLAALSSTMNHGAPLYNSTGHGNPNATGMAAQPSATPGLLSATSLLQKAAQMGSVSSTGNPDSLFRSGFGTSSCAPMSSTDALCWPQTSSSKNLQNLSNNQLAFTRQYGPAVINGNSVASDLRPSRSGFVSNTDNSAANIQEMVASFNNGGAHASSFFMGGNTQTNLSSKVGAVPTLINNTCNQLPILQSSSDQSPTSITRSQRSDRLLGHHNINNFSAPNPTSVMALMPTHIKMEDGSGVTAAVDNFTRDFLGVRGHNINGVLLHDRVDNQLAAHYHSNSRDNLSSEDENNISDGGHFHVQPSWDQNQL